MPKLKAFGCMIRDPLIYPSVRTIMTNSAKFAHYGSGLTKRDIRFASLTGCVKAACTSESIRALPL
ncbi:hypothetical protein E4T48_06792 [Aureobasidium sp. EXF-10727]|nr:hypothetical protein E4T48_06792 [Aureobasidium sp. EXF-10727]